MPQTTGSENGWLVLTDVDAVQSYVFSSVRMATIVGASRRVQDVDTRLHAMAKEHNGTASVASGGVGMFVFPDRDQAQEFAANASREAASELVDGHVTVSEPQKFAQNEVSQNFAAAYAAALKSVERQKRCGWTRPEFIHLGLARVCEACGQELASERRKRSEEFWSLGPACVARMQARDDALKDQLELFGIANTQQGPQYQLELDFNRLVGENDYLALIVLDGDGLGDRLKSLSSFAAFETFSKRLDELVEKALRAGLTEVRRLDSTCPAAGAATKEKRVSLPAVVLFCGGDDLVVATRGTLAFPFLAAFNDVIQSHPDWSWAGTDAAGATRGPIGFSAGISITHPGFPFRTNHAIAEGLLKNAKKTARQNAWLGGAVDYAIVTEASGDIATILADRVIRHFLREDKLSLSARPWNLTVQSVPSDGSPPGMGAAGKCEFERFGMVSRQLKEREFPRNKLFALRNIATATAWANEPVSGVSLTEIRKALADDQNQWLARIHRDSRWRDLWQEMKQELSDTVLWERRAAADLADGVWLWSEWHETSGQQVTTSAGASPSMPDAESFTNQPGVVST